MKKPKLLTIFATFAAVFTIAHFFGAQTQKPTTFSDYRTQAPGVMHKITVADLPEPYATTAVDNGPRLVSRPKDAWPKAPAGFKVELYASGLENPREIRTAPNGDLFLAESDPGVIKVFRGIGKDGKAEHTETFATGLNKPFGIAFYPVGPNPQWIYIGNTDSVVRFPYSNGDLKARGAPQKIADLPGGGRLRGGGHWTRDIAFSEDGKKMYVSVGSHSNVDDTDNNPVEFERADVLEFNPDGSGRRVFASGIRNAGGGIAVNPQTGELWCSVNERDALGDNLVPDYITHLQEGGFYGWPWWYIGRDGLLRRQAVSGHVPRRHLCLRTRLLEPQITLRLRSHPRAVAPDRARQRRIRRFPHRLRNSKRRRLGTPGGNRSGSGWSVARKRRRIGIDLARELLGEIA